MDSDSARYDGHRGLTLAVHRTDESPGEVGDFHAGVVEWGLETGASLRTEAMALEFARAAADAGLDEGKPPAEALALSGAEPVAMSTKGLVVDTGSGPAKVFYNGEASDPDENPDADPYLAETGWYFQYLDYDEGPVGPYDDHEDCAEAAVERGERPSPSRG